MAIDATCGAGGHTKEIAKSVGRRGRVLAIDRDEKALEVARSVFRGENVIFMHSELANIKDVADKNGFFSVSGIMADLGVSSMQLDDPARGFSLKSRGVLDMRMDQKAELTAFAVVNNYSEERLSRIISDYGEERNARKIARAIVNARKKGAIEDTNRLAEVVRGVIRARETQKSKRSKIDPATRLFQAIRIEVNQELKQIESALPQMVSLLRSGGRLAIISFHSLEDRIVKNFFRRESKDCICPSEYPKCLCDHRKSLRVVTKKPISPSEKERRVNPRSRSARLRVSEKI